MCGAPPCRCSVRCPRKPGCSAGQPTKMRSACARWRTSRPATNFITGVFSKSGTSPLSLAPETLGSRQLGATRPQQVIEQDGGTRNADRRSQDSHGFRGEWMFKGVSQQVESQEKEERGQEAHQTPEGSRQAAAKYQRPWMAGSGPHKGFRAHSSILIRNPAYQKGILDSQKLEIGEMRRCVFLLQGRAANAAGILALEYPVGLDQNFTVTHRIRTTPLFSSFHDHDGLFSLRSQACWDGRECSDGQGAQ